MANQDYKIYLCTTNLHASQEQSGHPTLKHCFAKIEDSQGQEVKTLSYGLQGVSSESNGQHSSALCTPLPQRFSYDDIRRFYSVYNEIGRIPYHWGESDCCSVVNQAVTAGLGIEAPKNTQIASEKLKQSRNLSRNSRWKTDTFKQKNL